MQIVVRQISGLGNQLFQYAAGRFYAQRYKAPFRLAVDLARNQVSHGFARPFLLSHFSIPIPMKPLSAMDRAMFSDQPQIRMLLPAVKAALGIQVFTEPMTQRYHFLQDIPLDRRVRTLYLFGYWQAHQIPDAVEAELRRDLQLSSPPSGRNLDLMEQIAACRNPVSLHVRRGDYTLAAEGKIALPLSYYASAIAYCQARLEDPTFFVFSDDMEFARANLPGNPRAVFVDHNDDASSHEDLRLMSACRHHIIANSSFSWWGAWLNPRADKIVYAPKYWLLNRDSYFPDLFPASWLLDDFPPRSLD